MSQTSEPIQLSTKLSVLKEKGLISEVEYQDIVSSGQLVEREFLKLLVSKYRFHGANIWKFFEVLTEETPATEKPKCALSLKGVEDTNRPDNSYINPLNEKCKNPLLINTVVRGIFDSLTFHDIKQFRLVCHQWDSTAQPFLRRKGIIHFKPRSLLPSTFLETFADKLPDLPYTSFKFSNEGSTTKVVVVWHVSQLEMFFEKWGKSIKQLELWNICLEGRSQFDISPWLEKATMLTKLKIICSGSTQVTQEHALESRPGGPTALEVGLCKLKSVKYLHLHGRRILLRISKENIIEPVEIVLKEVRLEETEMVEPTVVKPIMLNEYIDFSKAKNIILGMMSKKNLVTLDMAGQNFKADNVDLKNIHLLNWNKARGKIDCLAMKYFRLIERNELGIKKFIVNSCTIDMTRIPLTIEQLQFANNKINIRCENSVVLPKLVFLSFKGVRQNILDKIYRFSHCNNLVEIAIETNERVGLNMHVIPKTVKIIQIQGDVRFGGYGARTLDKLIFKAGHSSYLQVVCGIYFKILVIDFNSTMNANNVSSFESSMISLFKWKDHRYEKIIVGGLENLFHKLPFEKSSFARLVDGKSNCYEFVKNKKVGKSITVSQYFSWKTLNALMSE